MGFLFDGLTEGAQRAMVAARWAAMGLRQPAIDTEHLLLGLLDQQDDGLDAELRHLAIDPIRLLRALLAVAPLGGETGPTTLELTPAAARAIAAAHRVLHRFRRDCCTRIRTVDLFWGCVETAAGPLRHGLLPFGLVPTLAPHRLLQQQREDVPPPASGAAPLPWPGLGLQALDRSIHELRGVADAAASAGDVAVADALRGPLAALQRAVGRLRGNDGPADRES